MTGGTGGLGVGVVRALVEAGHEVVVTWVVERELEHFPDDLRARCRLEKVDVLSEESLASLIAGCEPAGVWALVHLVGGYLDGARVAGMDMEQWDRQFTLNARSTALGPARRAARDGRPRRRPGGRRRDAGRGAALRGRSAYAASKAALLALVTAASEEVKRSGVCVNAVLPSVIDTPANRSANPDADPASWVRPDEIGAVIAFLCSTEASAVTGAAIPVYGKA